MIRILHTSGLAFGALVLQFSAGTVSLASPLDWLCGVIFASGRLTTCWLPATFLILEPRLPSL